MTFILNRWYAISWDNELTDKPLGRRILDHEITIFRKSDGTPAAVSSRCPHRFAPMYYGEVVGNNIRCRYHGLLFNEDGNCVENPDGSKPPPMCLTKYHVTEQDTMIWVWIGDGEPDRNIPDVIKPSITFPSGAMATGYIHVNCNYMNVLDNLVDHSHAPQLHELLRTEGAMSVSKHDLYQDEDSVMLETKAMNTNLSPFFAMMWSGATGNIDQRVRSTWTEPSNIVIQAAVTNTGGQFEDLNNGTYTTSSHIIVPETETSCHYFWGQARCGKLDDDELTQKIGKGIGHIFETEDVWIMEGQQKMMEGEEFWSLKPAILPQDKGTVMVRRRIEEIIKAQSSEN
jgi:vanillate O-demethylase monooxygenase subunit